MKTDRELLELIAAQVGKLTQDVGDLKDGQTKLEGQMGGLEGRMGGLEGGQSRLENIVTRIEHDHGQKLQALFDGYVQNNDRLDRIEKAVSNQEEFILKRVK